MKTEIRKTTNGYECRLPGILCTVKTLREAVLLANTDYAFCACYVSELPFKPLVWEEVNGQFWRGYTPDGFDQRRIAAEKYIEPAVMPEVTWLEVKEKLNELMSEPKTIRTTFTINGNDLQVLLGQRLNTALDAFVQQRKAAGERFTTRSKVVVEALEKARVELPTRGKAEAIRTALEQFLNV